MTVSPTQNRLTFGILGQGIGGCAGLLRTTDNIVLHDNIYCVIVLIQC